MGLTSYLPPPGESQELPGQVGGALHVLIDAFQMAEERVGPVDLGEHQGRMALDSQEEVVEVVGNTSGQGPDGFQALGLLELGLEPPLLGHVQEDVQDDRPLGEPDDPGEYEDIHGPVVPGPKAHLKAANHSCGL